MRRYPTMYDVVAYDDDETRTVSTHCTYESAVEFLRGLRTVCLTRGSRAVCPASHFGVRIRIVD